MTLIDLIGWAAAALTLLALHAVLLPVNLLRLFELRRVRRCTNGRHVGSSAAMHTPPEERL